MSQITALKQAMQIAGVRALGELDDYCRAHNTTPNELAAKGTDA